LYKNLDRSFFHFVTNHAFDRQTDEQTDRILIARPRLHSMQHDKNAEQNSHHGLDVVLGTGGET